MERKDGPCRLKVLETGRTFKFDTITKACEHLKTNAGTILDWFWRWEKKGQPQKIYTDRKKRFTITKI